MRSRASDIVVRGSLAAEEDGEGGRGMTFKSKQVEEESKNVVDRSKPMPLEEEGEVSERWAAMASLARFAASILTPDLGVLARASFETVVQMIP